MSARAFLVMAMPRKIGRSLHFTDRKQCIKCKEYKYLSGFSKGKDALDRSSWCKECHNNYRRENRERICDAHKEWHKNNPDRSKRSQFFRSRRYEPKRLERIRNERLKDCKLAWANGIIRCVKYRSKKFGVPFDITVDDIYELCGDVCPALGVELLYPKGRPEGKGGIRRHAPSLDRIVPSLGYVKGNIAVISAKANSIKNDGSLDDIRMVYEWLKDVLK